MKLFSISTLLAALTVALLLTSTASYSEYNTDHNWSILYNTDHNTDHNAIVAEFERLYADAKGVGFIVHSEMGTLGIITMGIDTAPQQLCATFKKVAPSLDYVRKVMDADYTKHSCN